MREPIDKILRELAQVIQGPLEVPGSNEYNQTCHVFNALVAIQPYAVIYPMVPMDIVETIHCAKAQGWKVSIRNGGHSTYGQGLTDQGLVLDMKYLHRVRVDLKSSVVHVEAGALLKDLDAACVQHQLAVPAGDCPMVGVAGLVLGGGNGYLSRSFGLTCDNLLEARMIDGQGNELLIDHDSHPVLMKALKGAGQGNFGVITSLVLKAHPISNLVYGGTIIWNWECAEIVIKKYGEFMAMAPHDFSLYLRIHQGADLLPVVRAYGLFHGPVEQGMNLFAEIENWSKPLQHDLSVKSYWEMQQVNLNPAPFRPGFYWKNFLINQMDDQLIGDIIDCVNKRPTQFSRFNLDVLGGAIRSQNRNNTSFIHRDDLFIASIIGIWSRPEDAEACRIWTEESRSRMTQSGYRSYQNYADPFLPNAPRAYFGSVLKELIPLKQLYDPENLFKGTL